MMTDETYFTYMMGRRKKKNAKPTQIPANRHFIKISQHLAKKKWLIYRFP